MLEQKLNNRRPGTLGGIGLIALIAVVVLAIGAAVGTYFLLKQVTDRDMGWLCVLAALPFALCGFFRYNGMTAERFAIALIHHYLTPPRLLFRCENILAKLMGRYEHD